MFNKPHVAWSLSDVLGYIEDHQSSLPTALPEKPLRCLKRGTESNSLHTQTYTAQKYVAVSYTWPDETWTRLYDSNVSTKICDGEDCGGSAHISMFMIHVLDWLRLREMKEDGKELHMWVDHSCINQADDQEKQKQVAIMDRIYSGAHVTAVMLEDIELTAEEYDFLRSLRRRIGEERARFLALVRKVLSARWFRRAWCSQEYLLSRGTFFFMHQSGRLREPIAFPSEFLAACVTHARIYDATVPRLPERRGIASMYQPVAGLVFVGSFAWAYGVVQTLKCYEVFDKVALVLNLVRTPPHRRLTAFPSTKGNLSVNAGMNVAKIVNVLAIQNKDFSLLQAGHQNDNPFIGLDGFGWAALPIKGDEIADSWRHHIYEIAKDRTASLTAAGLKLRGPIERIVSQQDWTVTRVDERLHVTVDHIHRIIDPDWLQQPDAHSPVEGSLYDRDPQMSRLRDILYAIESFNAEDIWPTFLPADETWILRGLDDGFRSYSEGSLRARIIKEYIRPGTTQRTIGTGSAFLHRGDVTSFNVVTLSSGFRMVVGSNMADMRGCEVFQPYVMRTTEFGAHGITSNAFLLRAASSIEVDDVRRVEGHIRCFQLVPEDAGVRSITLT
ncbi:hypothetical protein CKM354_000789000 [Cercospora kikuchii]|uniref:Heterokaryon incompatibility domain-containing protein n=1 Tax=Cercospora kikuchii TaxID=84275 RepID=A0A9P3FJ39_9PEZI|nr:uncharacterized protein CKM354_000789000 [Cercospora kikuchii]GIZ44699.1 hypothetical protein CKM354_000789000 [Cercospora kikuchii]